MCGVWTSTNTFPGWASISLWEPIQGSQTSIMQGISHLAPNETTYSLIPVILLLWVAQTHLVVRVGRCPTCKEVAVENIALGDGSWVRNSAKPDGVSHRGLYLSAGPGGFNTRFSGENHFKTQSLSLWCINQKSPVCPWDGCWALGGGSICVPLLRTSKTG